MIFKMISYIHALIPYSKKQMKKLQFAVKNNGHVKIAISPCVAFKNDAIKLYRI